MGRPSPFRTQRRAPSVQCWPAQRPPAEMECGFPLLGCVGRRAFPFTRGRAATRMRRSKNRLPVLATPTSGHFSRSTQTMALVGGADVAGGQSGERRPRRYHCQSRGRDASRARGDLRRRRHGIPTLMGGTEHLQSGNKGDSQDEPTETCGVSRLRRDMPSRLRWL